MERIGKEIIVNAPLEKVFNYVENPLNWPEFWTNLTEVANVQSLPSGGYKAKYEYEMRGMRFKSEGEFITYIPNQWIVLKVKGGIKSTLTFTFRSIKDKLNSGQTRIILTIMYEIPVLFVGKLAEIVVRNINERDIGYLRNNLSARFLLDY